MSENVFVEFDPDEASAVCEALYRLRREKDFKVNYLNAFSDRKPWMDRVENEIKIINRALRSMGEKIDGKREGDEEA